MIDEPAASPPIKLLAGLGNPGRRYARTRHNAGFMVLDELARRLGSRSWREERLASVADVVIGGQKILLVKPQTFMNLSGQAVKACASRAGVTPEGILVVVDDLDLPFGRLRLRPGGSAGGHNGLRSIASEMLTNDFARLRVGIGRPDEGDPIDYVLASFTAAEMDDLPAIVSAACEMAVYAIDSGLLMAMNLYNGRGNVLDPPSVRKAGAGSPPNQMDSDHA